MQKSEATPSVLSTHLQCCVSCKLPEQPVLVNSCISRELQDFQDTINCAFSIYSLTMLHVISNVGIDRGANFKGVLIMWRKLVTTVIMLSKFIGISSITAA